MRSVTPWTLYDQFVITNSIINHRQSNIIVNHTQCIDLARCALQWLWIWGTLENFTGENPVKHHRIWAPRKQVNKFSNWNPWYVTCFRKLREQRYLPYNALGNSDTLRYLLAAIRFLVDAPISSYRRDRHYKQEAAPRRKGCWRKANPGASPSALASRWPPNRRDIQLINSDLTLPLPNPAYRVIKTRGCLPHPRTRPLPPARQQLSPTQSYDRLFSIDKLAASFTLWVKL